MDVKQVIVIRKDLKMRRGKEIAQGSHGSMAWLTNRIREIINHDEAYDPLPIKKWFSEAELNWILGAFAKITLQVESEEGLREIERQAKEAGLETNLIVDSGRTEFNGIPTATVVAIGPDSVEKLDSVTGKNSLLAKAETIKLY